MENKTIKQRRRSYTRQFYRGNVGALVLAMLQILLMTGANLLISWLMQQLIDVVTGEDTRFTLTQVAILCGLCVVLLALIMLMMYGSRPRFIAKAIGQYKQFVFEKISRKGISAFTGENTAFYISALNNDANSIESDYLSNLFGLAENILLFVGALGMMLWYSPLLTAIGIALSLLPVVASILAGNRVAEAEQLLSSQNSSYTATLTDCLSGFSVIKSFQAETAMCRLFAERIREVSHAKTRRMKTMIVVQGMGMVAGVIAQFGVFLVGAALALGNHSVSAGVVLAFVQLMNYVVNPIGAVPQCLAQIKASTGLIDKVAAALEENVRDDGGEAKTSLERGIMLQNLSFGYDAEQTVLKDVSFTFETGKSYAIVGASGSGKSTLLNLLMAAYSGYSGSISYDQTELRQISSESLYNMISVVQQNVFIFNASIRDNITMFSPFPKEEVDHAIALSGLTGLIDRRGEEYLCGENGSGLSGGEKQRISIARSLLKRAQVLLVDEATAALDAQTAYQVANAILDLEGLTRVVVTHALDQSVLKRYDCVLTLKNGQIVESGTFDELMEKKGYFYSLFTVSQ